MTRLWLSIVLVALGCSGSAPSSRTGALPANRTVPLETVVFSGNRYVIRVDFDGVAKVPLMVHGNSRMYLSLTHHTAERLQGGPVAKVEEYGYSSRGKGSIHVKSARIGEQTFSKVPEVPVFDFTDDGESPVQGMVGIPFLLDARAAVDFTRDELLLGVAAQREPDRRLLRSGYRWAPISILAGGRTAVEARFPAIDRVLPITPSTVSAALTLHLPPFEGKIDMVRSAAPDRSPSGTTPDEFHAEGVELEIAGVPMRSAASFEDLAEYGKIAERDLESYGMLGFDWMKEHRAVIDYANRRLYFIP
ncbi:MAG TPA: hypothetical protein VFP58_07805 [Candidatus Eisenbacteria bacterium]|nr:hypothetical protein [Candidatus Eisenbacteria bacterium]